MAAKRYFEFVEGSSSKFWEIWRESGKVFTRYGRIGAAGQITEKNEGSEAKATKLFDKLVREKTGKGYLEKKASKQAVPRAKEKAAKKPAKKQAKVKVPRLTVASLLKRAQKAGVEQEERIAEAYASPSAVRAPVALRPSNPVHWGYPFSFDKAIAKEERAELSSFFKRFTKVGDERGGFVVVAADTKPEVRREAWEKGVVIELEQLRAQLPPTDVAARTERLLKVLERPGSERWCEVVMLLSTWDTATLPEAIAVAERELAKWPDAVRTAVDAWKDRPELRALTRVAWGDIAKLMEAGSLEHVTTLKTQDADGLRANQQHFAHVKSLDLSGKTNLAESVEACTALENLEQLELQQPTYTSGTATLELGKLLASPHLQKLRAFSLYGFELAPDALEALAGCPQPLERLRLYYGKMKASCGAILANVAAQKRLVSLDVKYNDLGPKGARALFANPGDWRALRVLDVSANEIGDRGVEALAAADLSDLRWLNISSNANKEQLTAAAAKALANAPALGRLDTLNLYGHPIGAEGVAALLESPCLRSMKSLCVASARVSLADLFSRCGNGEPVALEGLHLGSPDAAPERADWSRATFLSTVRTLNLDSLDGAEYEGLLQCPHLGELQVLSLGCDYSGNDEKGFAALVSCRPPPNLRYLNLSGVKLSEKQAKALAASALGQQLWGLELMQSYTTAPAWRALYDGGVPLMNYVMFDSNPASEHSPLTTWREEW